jgi:hypothetical protein
MEDGEWRMAERGERKEKRKKGEGGTCSLTSLSDGLK